LKNNEIPPENTASSRKVQIPANSFTQKMKSITNLKNEEFKGYQ